MAGPELVEAGREVVWAVRVLALADPRTGLWGAAWIPAGGSGGGVLGVGADASARELVLVGDDPSGPWRLEGEGVEPRSTAVPKRCPETSWSPIRALISSAV